MAFRIFKPKKYHLGMTGDEVKAALEGGGGGGSVYPEIKIKFTAINISPVEVPAHSILRISDESEMIYAFLVTRESFILPEDGEVNCTTDLIFLDPRPFDLSTIKVEADFTENLSEVIRAMTGAIEIESEPGVSVYFLYDKTEISVELSSK